MYGGSNYYTLITAESSAVRGPADLQLITESRVGG